MIIFELRPCTALRRAVHKSREYWLHEMIQPDKSLEITLTKINSDGSHVRIDRWNQLSPASDETTARALILEQEATRIRT